MMLVLPLAVLGLALLGLSSLAAMRAASAHR